MPKLRPLPASEVARLLKKAGFAKVRQRGSHMIFARTLADGSTRTVPVPVAREIPVGTLKSIVKDCGWEPSYNMRGHSQKNEVELEFNALIRQVSGEDWTNAALTLSTASPTVAGYNPRLEPLYVALAPLNDHPAAGDAERYGKAVAGRRQAYDSISAKPGSGEKEANVAANDSASPWASALTTRCAPGGRWSTAAKTCRVATAAST